MLGIDSEMLSRHCRAVLLSALLVFPALFPKLSISVLGLLLFNKSLPIHFDTKRLISSSGMVLDLISLYYFIFVLHFSNGWQIIHFSVFPSN